jgi:RNA polymerase primary sigma factor
MFGDDLRTHDVVDSDLLSRPDVRVLSPEEERALLVELDECKRLLLQAEQPFGAERGSQAADGEEIQVLVRDLLKRTADRADDPSHLVSLASRYNELRTRLAMANLRLVAHVARKYRNRGISHSDLLQEGFCGLLRAIDRYQPARETRLASYAVWWIRQALQRAVAAGAYPVRLNPRHLHQLALGNPELTAGRKPGQRPRSTGAVTTFRQIYSATRPAISLDSHPRADASSALLDVLTYPAHEEPHSAELDEYLVVMMKELKPREQVVLQLRFGLGGKECHSLSQVSEVLDVSKERIRQIQEAALEKLRSMARGKNLLCEASS